MHTFECPCIVALQHQSKQRKYEEIILKWQQMDINIANDPEFDRDDFTVVIQPFTLNYTPPVTSEGFTDYTIHSYDCFHFSQKGNAKGKLEFLLNKGDFLEYNS